MVKRGKIIAYVLVIVMLFATLAVLPAPSVLADEPFNPEVNVHDGSTQTEPSIAVDGNGTAYIVWLEDNSVFFSKTTNAGATFTEPVTVGEGSFRPMVAVDEKGFIYIYNGNTLFKSADGGRSFTYNVTVAGGYTRSMVAEGGRVYIAYSEAADYLDWSDRIWFMQSTDAGYSFEERKSLSTGFLDLYPSVASNNGKVYAIWGSGGNAGRYVEFSRSLDGGETFEPPQQISGPDVSLTDTGKAIAIGPEGEVYAVWYSCTDYKVFISKSTDGGESFSQPIRINDPNTTGSKPSVAIDKVGSVHVVWTGNVNGTWAIYYDVSTDGGETFSTDIKLNSNFSQITPYNSDFPFLSSIPSLDIADNGEIFVVWNAGGCIRFTTTNNPVFPVTLNSSTEITVNSINLTWSQSASADFGRYELHMATHADFVIDGSTLVASLTDETATGYNVTGLAEDTSYYFKVRVYNSGGLYADSNEVSGRTGDEIPTPVVLNAPTGITNSSMILTWSRNGNTDFARYELYMSEDADFDFSPSTLVATIMDQDTTTYNVTSLAEDETYYFKVRVYDVGGSQADSNEISGKTLENDSKAVVQKDLLSVLGDNYLGIILVLLILIAAMVAAVKRQWIMNHIRGEKGRNEHERSEAKD